MIFREGVFVLEVFLFLSLLLMEKVVVHFVELLFEVMAHALSSFSHHYRLRHDGLLDVLDMPVENLELFLQIISPHLV
jgi:hypothetical protein